MKQGQTTTALICCLWGLLIASFASAQCVQNDWYSHSASLPAGSVGAAAQNPSIHFTDDGQFIYTVTEYSGVSELYFDGDLVQPNLCGGPGRGVIIQKFNTSGGLVWRKIMCWAFGLVQGNAVDDTDALYIGGYFRGSLSFESNELDYVVPPGTGYFLLRLLPNGDLDWVETGESIVIGLEWTSDGLLFMLGVSDTVSYRGVSYTSPEPSMSRDWLVFKTSSSGDVIWNDAITGSNVEMIYDVVCHNGVCLVQGRFEEDVKYQDEELTSTVTGQLFQLALRSSDGQKVWMNQQDNSSCIVHTHGAEVLEDTLVMSSGYYVGSPPTFTIGGQTIVAQGGADGYLLLQNFQTGEVYWLNSIGGNGIDGVVSMAKSNTGALLAGFFDSPSINYQGLELINHSQLNDPFIIVVDKEGKPSCQVQDLGTSAADAMGSISCHGNEIACTLGSSDSTAFGQFAMTSVGGGDLVLWKTCLPCDRISSVSEESGDRFLVYPNPTTNFININLSANQKPAAIGMLDMLGKEVLHRPYATQLDVSHLPAGNYVVAVYSEEGVLRKRVVVE